MLLCDQNSPRCSSFSLHVTWAAAGPVAVLKWSGNYGQGPLLRPCWDRAGLLPWSVTGKRHIGNSSSSASLGKFFSSQHHKKPTSVGNITIVLLDQQSELQNCEDVKYCLLPSILQFKLMFHIIFLVNILFVCMDWYVPISNFTPKFKQTWQSIFLLLQRLYPEDVSSTLLSPAPIQTGCSRSLVHSHHVDNSLHNVFPSF